MGWKAEVRPGPLLRSIGPTRSDEEPCEEPVHRNAQSVARPMNSGLARRLDKPNVDVGGPHDLTEGSDDLDGAALTGASNRVNIDYIALSCPSSPGHTLPLLVQPGRCSAREVQAARREAGVDPVQSGTTPGENLRLGERGRKAEKISVREVESHMAGRQGA